MTLPGLSDVRALLRSDGAPIFYVCTIPYNLLNARRWLNDLKFVAAGDFFAGELPDAYVLDGVDLGAGDSYERMNVRLLDDPGARRFVAEPGSGGRALFLMLDEESERRARALGLEVCLPPAALRRHLDDKLTTTRIAEAAGIRCVPHVLGRVDGYSTLRRLAGHLGPDLVVQLAFGDSGQTTYFISDESDFALHAAAIADAPEVKVMRRIRCRSAAIEGCVTRRGVAVGPLATELCGFPELTPYRGGWCGNEVGADLFEPAIVDAAVDMTRRFGQKLATTGYRGVYGLDFLLDEDSGELFLGELNPRITGLTPLTTQVASDLDCMPLLVLHLLEWSGVDCRVDLDELGARLRQPARGWSQLIVKQTAEARGAVTRAPQSGVWRMSSDRCARFVRSASEPDAVADPDEALLVRTITPGSTRSRGACLARVIVPWRVATNAGTLTARARGWIDGVVSEFEDPPGPRPTEAAFAGAVTAQYATARIRS